MLYLDELDKARLYDGPTAEANIQDNLLALFNGCGEILAEGSGKRAETIDVRGFTFLFSGAFEGLEKSIYNRLHTRSRMGFSAAPIASQAQGNDWFQFVTTDDLVAYGIKRELVGRISSIIVLPQIGSSAYQAMLTSGPGSIQEKYNRFFSHSSGVRFRITDAAVTAIAQQCAAKKTGARAVNGIVNTLVSDAIAMVDRDPTMNSIILDAGEKGCFLRYEHGERAHFGIDRQNEFEYWMKADSLDLLADTICNLYEELSPNSQPIPELRPFLDLALRYLKTETRPADFEFASLLKFAQCTGKENRAEESSFDYVMRTRFTDRSGQLDALHKKFNSRYWTPKTQESLVRALGAVFNHLKQTHNCSKICFCVEPAKTQDQDEEF